MCLENLQRLVGISPRVDQPPGEGCWQNEGETAKGKTESRKEKRGGLGASSVRGVWDSSISKS